MNQLARLFNFLFKCAVLGLALAFVVLYFFPSLQPNGGSADNGQAQPASIPLGQPARSFATAVNRAAPSVVSIHTRSTIPLNVPPEVQRLMGGRLTTQQNGLGSGVILTADGYILTNYHLLQSAASRPVDDIRVVLWDGRVAEVQTVGFDLDTDLAVLKVNLNDLPAAAVASSESTRTGDVVLAIGNAEGLSHTVTLGIVSAANRPPIAGGPASDLIQTDAAINNGNSGGALVNVDGEVVGINTSLGASNNVRLEGIGFAMPIHVGLAVMREIIEYGMVRRGWLGAEYSDLNWQRQEDGTAARPRGIVVTRVIEDSPAWMAGLRQGDVILSADGRPTSNRVDFTFQVAQMAPGSELPMQVLRGDQPFETRATLVQQPPTRRSPLN